MKAAILALAIVACSALTTRAQVMGGYYGLPPGGALGYGYGYIYQAWGYSPVPFGAGPAYYGGATGPQWTQWNGASGWTAGSQGFGQWNGNSGFMISMPPAQTYYHYRAPTTYQPHAVQHRYR